jgi:hypothetical protein
MTGAACNHALSVFGADNECSFYDAGYHGNAFCVSRDSIGNGVVWGRHNRIDHVSGGVEAAIEPAPVMLVAGGARRDAKTASGNQQHRKEFLHGEPP